MPKSKIPEPKDGLQLPAQDSATGRGLKTAVQALIGFVVGLVVVVWQVPGVPQAVVNYTQHHFVEILLSVGAPTAVASGVTSFIWNVLRKRVPNY